MTDGARPILVTGASGLLGANIVLAARDRGLDVVALSHRHRLSDPRVSSVLLDLTDAKALEALRGLRPSWVVHCAAATDLERCEADEAGCRRLNAGAPRALARWARLEGARFIHVSTDAVFDGRRGRYAEDDEAAPVSAYGRAKLAGEQAVLEELPDAAIVVRTSLYGWNMLPKDSLAEWFLRRLSAGTRVRGWVDAIFSPTLASDLARILLDMTDRAVVGVYHVASADAVSKYDFGVRIAEVFGLDPALIDPSSIDDAGLRAPRGRDLSLSVEKATRALGCPMPTVDEGLRRFRRERDEGTVARLKALGGTPAHA